MVDRGERLYHNWAAIAKQIKIKKGAAELTIWKKPVQVEDMSAALEAIDMEEPVVIKADHRLVKYEKYFAAAADGSMELHLEYKKIGTTKKNSEYFPDPSIREVGSKSVQDLKRDLLGWNQESIGTNRGTRKLDQGAGHSGAGGRQGVERDQRTVGTNRNPGRRGQGGGQLGASKTGGGQGARGNQGAVGTNGSSGKQAQGVRHWGGKKIGRGQGAGGSQGTNQNSGERSQTGVHQGAKKFEGGQAARGSHGSIGTN
jgi:hypothetical protein